MLKYKVCCISLYLDDIVRLKGLVAELKRRGHTGANKSQVIRAALRQVDLDKVEEETRPHKKRRTLPESAAGVSAEFNE